MKPVEAGLIVTVQGKQGLFVVLSVNHRCGRAVLLARDGSQRIERDVQIQAIEVCLDQLAPGDEYLVLERSIARLQSTKRSRHAGNEATP